MNLGIRRHGESPLEVANVQIIRHYRLQIMLLRLQHIHLIDRTAVRRFELLIALILSPSDRRYRRLRRQKFCMCDAGMISRKSARSRVEMVMDANGMKMR